MLNEFNAHRPLISPVSGSIVRPLWSVMIPTYNCTEYLRETLESVLAQDLGSEMMQIAVVDDCSNDSPKLLIEEIGKGRVEFYRQSENVGTTRNFQTCLELSRGYLIHQLHGDDVVRDGFYRTMQQLFEQYSQIGAAFCRTIIMDEESRWLRISDLELPKSGVLPKDWLEELVGVCKIQTPSMVVRRKVYEQLGGFDHRLRHSEDWEMWVRIADNYSIAHEVSPLALYRQRSNSNMHNNLKTGRHAEHRYKAIKIFESNINTKISTKIYNSAKQNCAFSALQAADYMINKGDFFKAINQIKASLKYRSSFKVVRSAFRIILLNGIFYFFKRINYSIANLQISNTNQIKK